MKNATRAFIFFTILSVFSVGMNIFTSYITLKQQKADLLEPFAIPAE